MCPPGPFTTSPKMSEWDKQGPKVDFFSPPHVLNLIKKWIFLCKLFEIFVFVLRVNKLRQLSGRSTTLKPAPSDISRRISSIDMHGTNRGIDY